MNFPNLLFPSDSATKRWTSLRASPNSVFTLGVLTVRVKDGCMIGGAHRDALLVCYLQHTHSPRATSTSSKCISTESSRPARVLVETLFVGTSETSCFGGLRSTFRERCRSEWLYVDVQISWQAQCFGHGGDCGWSSACSVFVAGSVNRDFWTCGSFSDIALTSRCCLWKLRVALAGLRDVSLDVRNSWQTQRFVDLEEYFVDL